ncbi:unnamed protein product (macronuclear) [Paramecium tetraurelia]|uniref:Uncharacterized protein n=1 Tax=Paramecium tetraurelia TaxID=5888 RepID=A0DE98_PARTE|nr:uncharacterized protein GSPATT00039449001 [Paramecium tetraurelia]CAK81365.1 unnamed protein product [Paramecium tetraurelia]|eukprot:XP_001448762.1 hypothetical protein (macronuclear) [Paramecium tetraurelia strain d4-2]
MKSHKSQIFPRMILFNGYCQNSNDLHMIDVKFSFNKETYLVMKYKRTIALKISLFLHNKRDKFVQYKGINLDLKRKIIVFFEINKPNLQLNKSFKNEYRGLVWINKI